MYLPLPPILLAIASEASIRPGCRKIAMSENLFLSSLYSGVGFMNRMRCEPKTEPSSSSLTPSQARRWSMVIVSAHLDSGSTGTSAIWYEYRTVSCSWTHSPSSSPSECQIHSSRLSHRSIVG